MAPSSSDEAVRTSASGASLTYLGVGRPHEGAPHAVMADGVGFRAISRGPRLTVVAATDAATRTWQTPLAACLCSRLAEAVVLSPRMAALGELLKMRLSGRGPQAFYIQGLAEHAGRLDHAALRAEAQDSLPLPGFPGAQVVRWLLGVLRAPLFRADGRYRHPERRKPRPLHAKLLPPATAGDRPAHPAPEGFRPSRPTTQRPPRWSDRPAAAARSPRAPDFREAGLGATARCGAHLLSALEMPGSQLLRRVHGDGTRRAVPRVPLPRPGSPIGP